MPTPTGLPKVGEVWERKAWYPGDGWVTTRFVVLQRGRGDYWSMRVYVPGRGRQFWVDPAAWFAKGELKFIDVAGPKTKRKVGLA